MKSITAASVLAFIKFTVLPDMNLIAWVKKARTSAGFRKTVVKFAQYGIAATPINWKIDLKNIL